MSPLISNLKPRMPVNSESKMRKFNCATRNNKFSIQRLAASREKQIWLFLLIANGLIMEETE